VLRVTWSKAMDRFLQSAAGETDMTERVVYLNGTFVPESKASVSVFDRSFMSGDGIYDVARTFGHKANKLLVHCRRFAQSARYTRIPLGHTAEEMEAICLELFEHNKPLLAGDDDYMFWMIASRGIDPPSRNPLEASKATVVAFNMPINYARFAKFYKHGAHLITASTRRTPADCLDPRAKITNKMNHVMAEFEAKSVDPEAIALMLGTDGLVAEASFANVFFVRDGRVHTPRSKNILLGIMRENVIETAPKANVEIVEGDFVPYDLYLADEIFISTTSFSILPISKLNGRAVGEGVPGPVTSRLISAWNRTVGLDVVDQALSHLTPAQRQGL
jgi:branched-chain amino acid aminotransferase